MNTNPEVVALLKRAFWWVGGVIVIAIVVTVASGCAARSPAGLPIIKINIEGHKLTAEVASTPEQRTRGLMYRRELGRNSGMLFVYQESAALSFWMKNTFIPLSIAFIAEDGSIMHITDMAAQTLKPHASPEPVLYALEMNRGWFSEKNIRKGAHADFTLPDPNQ